MKYQFAFVFLAVVLFYHCGAGRLPLKQIKFRSCKQSSHFYADYFNCARAFDGKYTKEDCISKVSHTEHEMNPWWSGTLKEEAIISKVRIVGRTYALSSNQLNSFKIVLDGGKVCAKFRSSNKSVEYESFTCVGISKTVKIQATGSSYLSLCEVSVYGQPKKICPPGYKNDKSQLRCYSKPSSIIMDYSNAKAWCKKHGGFLPEFTTKEEIDNFISFAPDVGETNYKTSYGLNGYWLGASRKGNHFDWESNGAKVTVNAFAKGEPNNAKGQENRLQLVKNPNKPKHYNKWNDGFSHWKMNVICQSH